MKNKKTSLICGFYSGKSWVFDPSEHVGGPIYNYYKSVITNFIPATKLLPNYYKTTESLCAV